MQPQSPLGGPQRFPQALTLSSLELPDTVLKGPGFSEMLGHIGKPHKGRAPVDAIVEQFLRGGGDPGFSFQWVAGIGWLLSVFAATIC